MEKSKIGFKYFKEEGYSPDYVNGAFGTLSPTKEIVIDFYYERNIIPDEQINELNKDGKLGTLLDEKPSRSPRYLGRMIKCGIIVNLESAKKIRDFIDRQIKALERIQ